MDALRSKAPNAAFISVLKSDEMMSKNLLPRMSDALLGCTIHLPKSTKGTACAYS